MEQKKQNNVNYSLNGLGNKVDKQERENEKIYQIIQTLVNEITQYKNITNFLVTDLMKEKTYEEIKEIDISDEVFTENYFPTILPYYLKKDTNTLVKIKSIFDGWKVNEEKSDENTGIYVYNHIESGREVAVGGSDQGQLVINLKKAIRKPVLTITE